MLLIHYAKKLTAHKCRNNKHGENTMKNHSDLYNLIKKGFLLFFIASVFAAGCATVPERNVALENARAIYEKAQANPEVSKNAPIPLHEAAQALSRAEKAKDNEEKTHLAYIAEKMAQIAISLAEQKTSEKEVEELSQEKNKIVLQARELELKKSTQLS